MRHVSILIAMLVTVPLIADAKPKAKPKGKKPAKAQINRTAKAHTNRAAKAHKAGKFDVALTELEAAYAIEPQPKLLFAIAQVQAKLEQCDGAIYNYQKFLATTKDKQKQAVVKQAIASCKTKLKVAAAPPAQRTNDDATVFRDGQRTSTEPSKPVEAEPPPPKQPPKPVEQPTTQPPTIIDRTAPPFGGAAGRAQVLAGDDAPPGMPSGGAAGTTVPADKPAPGGRSPWYKDVLGDVLVVGGVAAGAVSFVIYSGARSDLDAAEGAETIDEYQGLVDRAHDNRTYAVILAGASAALIGAGLVRYALRDSGESRAAVTGSLHLRPTVNGGLVTWSGGF